MLPLWVLVVASVNFRSCSFPVSLGEARNCAASFCQARHNTAAVTRHHPTPSNTQHHQTTSNTVQPHPTPSSTIQRPTPSNTIQHHPTPSRSNPGSPCPCSLGVSQGSAPISRRASNTDMVEWGGEHNDKEIHKGNKSRQHCGEQVVWVWRASTCFVCDSCSVCMRVCSCRCCPFCRSELISLHGAWWWLQDSNPDWPRLQS